MTYAHEFREFIQNIPSDKPADGEKYSGSTRVHYGLSNPTMRDFVKQWMKTHPNLSYDEWQTTLTDLYQGESIDECAFAGFLLGVNPTFRNQVPLSLLDSWIGHLQGWREIDTTCQSNYTAKDILTKWDAWQPFLVDLSQRDTIQHRRASLVLLVKPVRDSADNRLISIALANVERLKHEKDKLITKAISWILRESIKRHRQTIGDYVSKQENSLPPIAVREFKKKYETGKK